MRFLLLAYDTRLGEPFGRIIWYNVVLFSARRAFTALAHLCAGIELETRSPAPYGDQPVDLISLCLEKPYWTRSPVSPAV